MKYNINDYIKVKLTDYGRSILRERHEELKKEIPSLGDYTGPNEDEDGYSKFQGWVLMRNFGEYMHNGGEMPFDADVII